MRVTFYILLKVLKNSMYVLNSKITLNIIVVAGATAAIIAMITINNYRSRKDQITPCFIRVSLINKG